MTILRELHRPIVAAPMAGGPTTPALVAAVSGAGALGFLSAGMLTPGQLTADIAGTRELTGRPFGVNVFLPDGRPVDRTAVDAYAARLSEVAARWGVPVGEPVSGDDSAPAKLDLLLRDPVPVVSFVFNLPDADLVAAFQDRGTEVWATVNDPADALLAAKSGVDAIVVQGSEAGGHRGGPDDDVDLGVLPLLRIVANRIRLPLIAAGGIGDGAAVAAVLAAGATAAQLGTAFMRCPEAGTLPAHREALAGSGSTRLTRAFTGRRARGIVNDFMDDHDNFAPRGYPQVMAATRAILGAARRAGDTSTMNLWAGQAHELARDIPAAQVVEELTAEAFAALGSLNERFLAWQ